MIVESIRFGFNKAFNKNIFVFVLLLYSPLIVISSFILFLEEYIFTQILTLFFLVLYHPIIFSSLVLISFELIKGKKEINYKEKFKKSLSYYFGVLIINLFIASIVLLIFVPSILLSFLMLFSFQNLIIWLLIFFISLFVGIYVYFRLILSPFIYLSNRTGILDSVRTSWKICKGNVLKLFLICSIGILIIFSVGLVTILLFSIIFRNVILSIFLLSIFEVLFLIYFVFSISYVYNKYLRKNIKKIKK